MSEFAATCGESLFTEEEINAFVKTKALLLEQGLSLDKISQRDLLITVMNCKLRPESAAEKYKKWLDAMSVFDINSFTDVWENLPLEGDGSRGDWPIINFMVGGVYAGCGRDMQNRSVMWIKTRPVQIEEERNAIRSSVVYFTAIHADLISLRNGITFVLDTTNNDMVQKVGNENKLQRTWQSIPLRPQRIFILGAGYIKRALINAALAIASLFTKEKVIERIRFAELDEVRKEIADESLPVHVGGQSPIKNEEELVQWVHKRLANFPTLPEF